MNFLADLIFSCLLQVFPLEGRRLGQTGKLVKGWVDNSLEARRFSLMGRPGISMRGAYVSPASSR
jgi:hypothetical protein